MPITLGSCRSGPGRGAGTRRSSWLKLERGVDSPAELFALLIPDSLIEDIADWTNLYATMNLPRHPVPPWYKGKNWPVWWVRELAEKKVTPEEIKKVIGLSQLMGVVQYPSLQMYWSNEVPLFNCQIASVMSRDRFRAVASALTLCDRRMEADLKQKYDGLGAYWKIADFVEDFVKRARSLVIPGEYCTLDEVVIKSWCSNSLHSRLKFKPAGSGSMRTSLHTADGYLLALSFPRKKAPVPAGSNATSEVVYRLLTENLPVGTKVAADNLFNYVKLLKRLYAAGYHMFGTARPNNVPAGVVKYFSTAIKEKWQSLVVYKPGSPVYIFGWWDSKICLFMSNLPFTGQATVRRWHKAPAGTGRREVSAPAVGKTFNDTKSGADLNDLMMIQYGSRRPSPKWPRHGCRGCSTKRVCWRT